MIKPNPIASRREGWLQIGELFDYTQPVKPGAAGVRFEVELPAGDTEVKTWFIEDGQSRRGAYYWTWNSLEAVAAYKNEKQ